MYARAYARMQVMHDLEAIETISPSDRTLVTMASNRLAVNFVYIHVHPHVCTCVFTYVCTHVCTHGFTHVCTHVCTHFCEHIFTNVYMHAHKHNMSMRISTHMSTHMFTCMPTCMSIYMSIHMSMCMSLQVFVDMFIVSTNFYGRCWWGRRRRWQRSAQCRPHSCIMCRCGHRACTTLCIDTRVDMCVDVAYRSWFTAV